MRHLKPVPKPQVNEVTLVFAGGQQLVVPIAVPGQDFTYSGRLWSLNHRISQEHSKPIYSEITQGVVDDMHKQAAAVEAMAVRYQAQLDTLAAATTKQ